MLDVPGVKKIAELARLEISDAESNQLSQQLTAIMDHFQQLSLLNTTNIQPLISPTEVTFAAREDQVVEFNAKEEILKGAPERSGSLFKVPAVV